MASHDHVGIQASAQSLCVLWDILKNNIPGLKRSPRTTRSGQSVGLGGLGLGNIFGDLGYFSPSFGRTGPHLKTIPNAGESAGCVDAIGGQLKGAAKRTGGLLKFSFEFLGDCLIV